MNTTDLNYEGRINGDVLSVITDLLHATAAAELSGRKDLKRLCSIGLELLDNAQRHGARGTVAFEWHLAKDILHVRVSNPATRTEAERLLASVERIRAMSPDAINKAYADQLATGAFGSHGGAGLGLLQIARKVGNNISATISPTGAADAYICTSTVEALLNDPLS